MVDARAETIHLEGFFRADDEHLPGGFELFDQFDVRIVDALQARERDSQARIILIDELGHAQVAAGIAIAAVVSEYHDVAIETLVDGTLEWDGVSDAAVEHRHTIERTNRCHKG